MRWKSLAKLLPAALVAVTAGRLVAQPGEATLTQGEMAQRVAELAKEAEESNRLVLHLQAAARKDKDVIRLTCINDRLVQLKALRNLLDEAVNAFEYESDEAERTKRFDSINQTANAIRQQREAAQACAGELQLVGETQSDWTGPFIPDDPSDPLFPEGLEPPGYGSPFN